MQMFYKRIKNYDTIIWDWNGTLLNDAELAVQCINTILPFYDAAPISVSKYREIFDFPIIKYYQAIGLDLEKYSFKEIRDRYIDIYNARAASTSLLFPGTIPLLNDLKKDKRLFILSAVSQWHLDAMTEHFNLTSYFEARFGVNDHYASSKLERGRELMSFANISTEKTLLIGDTIHDFEVACQLKVDCLLIADGHQSKERLLQVTSNVVSRA